jgi:hypothetical protein
LKFNIISIFRRKNQDLIDEKEASRAKHQDFLKEEKLEEKREKRKAESIRQKLLKRINKDKQILSKEQMLGRTRGKPTHGPRGNKNE